MDITFLQTSDAVFYQPMLAETSKTVMQYCRANGFTYEQYIGVKRGKMPWQAAYNRVYLLKEMLDRGVTGWVFYLDADALIVHQEFDLRGYLQERDHYAAIFAGYCSDKAHDVNSGGFAVNLSHPMGRSLVLDYWKEVERISDEKYDRALIWEKDIVDDQVILCVLLEIYIYHYGRQNDFLFERSNESYVNNGPFILQELRSKYQGFKSRLDAITDQVAKVLDLTGSAARPAPGTYIVASHEQLLTGCGVKRFSGICSTGVGGMLLYGPYIPLAAGSWVVQVYGETGSLQANASSEVFSDVTSSQGTKKWSEQTAVVAERQKGILLEHHFELTTDAPDVEFRLSIAPMQSITIFGINLART